MSFQAICQLARVSQQVYQVVWMQVQTALCDNTLTKTPSIQFIEEGIC
jgi:hypothetical protein